MIILCSRALGFLEKNLGVLAFLTRILFIVFSYIFSVHIYFIHIHKMTVKANITNKLKAAYVLSICTSHFVHLFTSGLIMHSTFIISNAFQLSCQPPRAIWVLMLIPCSCSIITSILLHLRVQSYNLE